MPDEPQETSPEKPGGSTSPEGERAGLSWTPWAVAASIVVAVLAVIGILLATNSGDSDDPAAGPDATASPSASAEPSLEAWCEAYSPAVVLIQTFGTFPSPSTADDLIAAVSTWAAAAPPEIKDATDKVVAEYTELAEITKTGDEAAVQAQAEKMAADAELKTAVDDVARYFGSNCPTGIPPEEQGLPPE